MFFRLPECSQRTYVQHSKEGKKKKKKRIVQEINQKIISYILIADFCYFTYFSKNSTERLVNLHRYLARHCN